MLEQILAHIHNYFVEKVITGEFEVTSSSIALPSLKEDQYFRILGSTFNDGVYKYPATDLVDEKFTGEVWAMAVPRAVIALAQEIENWCSNNQAATSPFTSESFAGYSYSKGTSSRTGSPIGWQDIFRSRLNQWRKIS